MPRIDWAWIQGTWPILVGLAIGVLFMFGVDRVKRLPASANRERLGAGGETDR